MKNRLGALVAFVGGAVIWGFSPHFTGRIEPWDAHNVYYWVSLFGVGLLVGLVQPRNFLTSSLWVVAGQAAYAVFYSVIKGRDIGLLFPMGLVAMLLLSAPCYMGAYLGMRLSPADSRL